MLSVKNFGGGGAKKVTIDGETVKDGLNLKKYVTDYRCIMPYSIEYGSSVVYNDEVYFFSTYSIDGLYFKFDGEVFSLIESPSSNRLDSYSSAVIYNNEIHFFAHDAQYTSTYHYKFDGNTWTSVISPPIEMGVYGCAVTYNNDMHAFGGYNYYRHYKFDGNKWIKLDEDVPFQPYNSEVFVYNDKIYLLSGMTGYTFDGSTWEKINVPSAQTNRCICMYNGKIHLIGGMYNGNSQKSHYELNDDNSWTALDDLSIRFSAGQAAVFNNHIYLFGGYDIENQYNILNKVIYIEV